MRAAPANKHMDKHGHQGPRYSPSVSMSHVFAGPLTASVSETVPAGHQTDIVWASEWEAAVAAARAGDRPNAIRRVMPSRT